MSDRKSRFNLFKFKKGENNLNWSDDSKNANFSDDGGNDLGFPSFDSIIPESSPLRKNSDSSSGFFNDDFRSRNNFENSYDDFNSKSNLDNSPFDNDLEGVDEKYAKYIFSNDSEDLDFRNSKDYNSFENYNNSISLTDSNDSDNEGSLTDFNTDNDELSGFDKGIFRKNRIGVNNGNLKEKLLGIKRNLSNKDNSSKTLFGKITFILIFLVLFSSIFYFFVYQPFQDELNLERNSKLNEVNALYRGPLEINENAYSLKSQINSAYDVEEIKSIDVLMFATKDWRMYHSSRIVSCKDDFGRVMMSYGENKNIIMSVKDANDFVRDNDAKVLSNVRFEKVNTVIVPISLSRLQATAGLISVGSVVDIYSLSDNSSEYDYMDDEQQMISNETDANESSADEEIMNDESLERDSDEPLVSGATVLAILRSKDSGIVDSAISKSNTVIKGNQTNPFENTSSYSTDVEEQLKKAVLDSNNDNSALDSYLVSYGVRLSNFERMSNLGDLDSEYIILLEVPQGDVNFVINNMDNLILTIPTGFAPDWVVSELNETYYENLYQVQSLDFF